MLYLLLVEFSFNELDASCFEYKQMAIKSMLIKHLIHLVRESNVESRKWTD